MLSAAPAFAGLHSQIRRRNFPAYNRCKQIRPRIQQNNSLDRYSLKLLRIGRLYGPYGVHNSVKENIAIFLSGADHLSAHTYQVSSKARGAIACGEFDLMRDREIMNLSAEDTELYHRLCRSVLAGEGHR